MVLGLNAAGTLAARGTANALAAGSAGLVGGKAAFDKNIFFDKTLPTLLANMVAKRKEVLVTIRQGLGTDVKDYPLMLALTHLDTYYDAGTIPGTLTAIAADAGATAKKADTDLKTLLVITAAPEELQKRRAKAATFVKQLDQKSLQQLAQSLNVPRDEDTLGNVLAEISKANKTESFDIIAQKIKILFNEEI